LIRETGYGAVLSQPIGHLTLCNLRLWSLCKWDLRSCGILRSEEW